MKRFIPLLLVVLLFASCGKKGGRSKNSGFEAAPDGMVLIGAGKLEMGSSDEDNAQVMNSGIFTKTLDGFWIDQTEVTNEAYRQFVAWTSDSTMRRSLVKAGVDGFAVETDDDDETEETMSLNYKTRIGLGRKDKNYEEHSEALKDVGFFYSKEEAMDKKALEVDTRKLYYEWTWMDLNQAAKVKWDTKEQRYIGNVTTIEGEVREVSGRGDFIMRDKVYVYPDTLCWVRDINYSMNEPVAIDYFSHPSYNYYPVVGVSWKQAKGYCHWRSKHAPTKKYRRQYTPRDYRLPSEAEFEYASRGGAESSLYPWGNYYATNQDGCYLANFKPQRGDYAIDGGARTTNVAKYEPNDYGLYDMAGNVSEWVEDAYDENSYYYTHDLAPVYQYNAKESDKNTRKRKSVRGGSWKDASWFIQCGARNYEYQDSTRTYIGFRCVRDVPGTANDARR